MLVLYVQQAMITIVIFLQKFFLSTIVQINYAISA